MNQGNSFFGQGRSGDSEERVHPRMSQVNRYRRSSSRRHPPAPSVRLQPLTIINDGGNSSSALPPPPKQPPTEIVTTTRCFPSVQSGKSPSQTNSKRRKNHSPSVQVDPHPLDPVSHEHPHSSRSVSFLLPFFESMLDSCHKHTVMANHTHAAEEEEEFSDPISNSLCQDAIGALQRLLPHVEEGLAQVMATAPSATPDPMVASLVLRLCKFYRDISQGEFCPQAPHLLLHSIDLVPRIYLLFQCLAFQSASIHSMMTVDEHQQVLSCGSQICRTMAQLIHQLPDTRLVRAVVRDLVYLSKDLSLWYVLTTSSTKESSHIAGLHVSLLEETIYSIYWSDGKPREYGIDIPNTQNAILAMQWHTLSILNHLFVIRRHQRLSTNMFTSIVEDYDDHYQSMGGDADLYFVHLLDANELRVLFLVLRQSLLTESSSDSISEKILLCHMQSVASRLFVFLQSDWSKSSVPCISLLQETALIVGNSVRYCLIMDSQIRTAFPTAAWLLDELNGTMGNMAQLLSTVIYNPPNVSGSIDHSEVLSRIHRLLWPVLCESILGIGGNAVVVNERCSLDVVLLRTVQAIVNAFRFDSGLSPPKTEVMQHLLYLSDDPFYMDASLFILSYLLFHSTNRRFVELDLEDAIKMSHSTRTLHEDITLLPSDATIGSKRNLPYSAYSQKKRMKKDDDLAVFMSTSFGYYDDLVAFFDTARHRIARLNAHVQQRTKGVDVSNFEKDSLDSILADVLIVSSRLRLVLLLIEKQNTVSNSLSATPFLCRFIAGSVSSVSAIVDFCLMEYPIERDDAVLRRLVHLLFILALHIETATYLEDSTLFDARGICRSVKTLAKGWNVCSIQRNGRVIGLPFHFPTSFHDTIFGFALKRVQLSELKSTLLPPILDLEIIGVSVTIGLRSLCGLTVVWTGPIMKPMDNDINAQRTRLDLLSTTSSPELSLTEAKQEIERRSMIAIRDPCEKCSDPLRQILMWQSCAWIISSMKPNDLRKSFGSPKADDVSGCSALHLLVDIAISDPDPFVHDFASRELGKVLSTNNWAGLLALLASEAEWQQLELLESDFVNRAPRSKEMLDQILNRFFRVVDDKIHSVLAKSEVQPTIGMTHRGDSATTDEFRRSAARALCSLCINRNSILGVEAFIVRQALIRVIHLWTDFDDVMSSGLCLAELSLLSNRADICLKLCDDYWPTTAPMLIHAILRPKSVSSHVFPLQAFEKLSMTSVWRESQFKRISSFIQATEPIEFLDIDASQLFLTTESSLEKKLEIWLPFIVSHFVVNMNLSALQFSMSYRLYLRGRNRADFRHHKRIGVLSLESDRVCGFFAGDFSKSVPSRYWNRDLDNVTREFCLEPGLVEQVIPLILTNSSLDSVNFFMEKVLQGKISIEQLVKSREMFTLKYFVLEFGRDPGNTELVVSAMKKAAAIRQTEAGIVDLPSLYGKDVDSSRDAVGNWVSAHFMYLLVNVVQSKWTAKSIAEQVTSLRCLLPVLDFLPSSESSQYLPQVLATVNAALCDELSSVLSIDDAVIVAQRRLVAIHIFSKFVRVIAETQLESLGQNLTSIVVALVPMLSKTHSVDETTDVEKAYQRHGVALLEWLAGKEVLLSHFAEIPFLPATPLLDALRASLRSRGINFDNLQTVPTQGTQDASLRALASDHVSTDGDSRGAAVDASRQGALRHRLETICPLLENESVSVRRIVLQHISALLRSNRELFQALVENEGTTSWKQFLTVTYGENNVCRRWNVANFIELFLSRCTKEHDPETRTLLAISLGEVGAISANRFDKIETHFGSLSRYTTDPPWHSAPHHLQLQLVTTYLVVALKAAPVTSDQHKIAFSIQQLLDLLNDAGNEGLLSTSLGDDSCQGSSSNSKVTALPNNDTLQKPRMNESLIRKLTEAQVLDVVEPFWISDFHETGSTRPKTPPFFRHSSTFYDWLSTWCRYMVHCAYCSRKSAWTKMFYCCRTALRTQAGMKVAELLLPFLVLDRLCFGNGHDHAMLVNEIRDVLIYCGNDDGNIGSTMTSSEKRNAVSTIFSLLELLQHWVEPEVESKYCKKSRSPGKEPEPSGAVSSCDWQLSESAMRIEDLMSKIPLQLRGKAACNVGMYAAALRFLEMAARSTVVDIVFGIDAKAMTQRKPNRSRATGCCPEEVVDLLKDVLASLNDYETIEALVGDYNWVTPEAQTRDSIRHKESLQDWQGALHEYERAQQQNVGDPSMRLGALRCLLHLGHFDSIVQQVNYLQYKTKLEQIPPEDFADVVPIAVEAACRLGRWETLSELIEDKAYHHVNAISSENLYQVHLGKALLDVKRKCLDGAHGSLDRARLAVMESLANVASESYSRSYDHLVRLHALREIEDVSEILCSSPSSFPSRIMQDSTLAWNRRLDLVSSSGATTIMNVRLVLARIANDPVFEGSLFLRMGKRARKSRLLSAAANSFSQAEAAFRCVDDDQKAKWKSAVLLQSAKLNHSAGESSVALRMLGLDDIESLGMLKDEELVAASCQRVVENLGIGKHEMKEEEIVAIFVQNALQSTRWMIEGGLKEAADIVARFRVIHSVAPSFEKGHFHFAKYVDSLLQSRIMALQGRYAVHFAGTDDEHLRNHIISRDKACMRYVVLAIKHFAEAVILDVKHVYQALPRLLSLWFDFTAIGKQNGKENIRSGLPEGGPEMDSLLISCQDDVNKFMATTFKKISAQALYTSIPQLISRITHDDNDTAAIVQAMLRRVLIKYPAQAMWPLGWIRQSRDPQRQQIGVDIFHQATEALNKRESLHRLLVTSKTLLDYLYALAKKDVGDKVKDSMKVRALSDEVNLSEFVPPIQAALSASLASGDSSRSRDVFPRHIPRMRAIDETVGVMASKARPKKIKVYVIAADSVIQLRKGKSDCFDIGEIHFLLKQEAKGDLRKDARVQDLNNVVNRIMSSMDDNKGLKSQSRRLHLRTFCVTCLSEDTGLLEWVPHTASLRSMISKTYNPQADTVHGKRHGKRITNFNDPNLRVKFESVCQAAYFVSGNLTKAAALFENECLSKYPPVLYWWYVLQFPDPHAWYEARTRFALSTAAWSAVGHVIGLGDRHSENILLDKTSGECVHVDFDCIFDKGLYLPKPEVVPFRLTQNMVDALGPTGADGMYTCNLKAAMSALRNNRDTLLSVLEPFVKDPVINWKRYRSQQRGSHRTTDHDPMVEAKQKMSIIDERLRGIYNLRNPNMKKIRRTDHLESQQDDELSHPIPLSVEGQVHKLIAEATSNENLVQLYVGWMPWV